MVREGRALLIQSLPFEALTPTNQVDACANKRLLVVFLSAVISLVHLAHTPMHTPFK